MDLNFDPEGAGDRSVTGTNLCFNWTPVVWEEHRLEGSE